MISSPLRVVSVPCAHPYVESLQSPGVERLPDIIDPETGRWWPPAQLRATWVASNAPTFDLLHVHFGLESFTPAELSETAEALRSKDVPLVVTVHDLVNPHLPLSSQGEHRARMEVLVGAAAKVLTLTPGAAAEIDRRWQRPAVVLAHPHVVALGEIGRRPLRRGVPVVGVDLKDVRSNVAIDRLLPALLASSRELGVTLRVGLHADAADTAVARELRSLQRTGAIDLQVHARWSDAKLWDHLSSLDACVLPYAWGTHSGWLEACWDLGTPVVAPDCGYYQEQHPVAVYRAARPEVSDEELTTSLTVAISAALTDPRSPDPLWRSNFRGLQRREVAHAHADLYRGLIRSVAA